MEVVLLPWAVKLLFIGLGVGLVGLMAAGPGDYSMAWKSFSCSLVWSSGVLSLAGFCAIGLVSSHWWICVLGFFVGCSGMHFAREEWYAVV